MPASYKGTRLISEIDRFTIHMDSVSDILHCMWFPCTTFSDHLCSCF